MRRSAVGGGPPAWLIFIIAVAIVFGGYYLWLGVNNYLRTGGLGVVEATERANVIATATAGRQSAAPIREASPTLTPIPECQEFFVSVPSAIVRQAPHTNAAVVSQLSEGTAVCVIGRADEDADWYIVDANSATRRIEFAYMHESIIRAADPTPTATRTPTQLPTITAVPSLTPSRTPSPAPSPTINPNASDTPVPSSTTTLTPSDTPTPALQSA